MRLLAAALLMLGAAGCTDTTELPNSTITDANFFNDPSSYRAFLAKIYAGLAVSGQQGPAGTADIDGHRRGVLAVPPSLLGGAGAADRRGGDRLGRRGPPGDEHPALGLDPTRSSSPCTTGSSSRSAWRTSSCGRPPTPSWRSGNVSPELAADIQIFRAEARFLRALSYWHGIDLFGNIPLVTEDDPIGATPPQQSTRQEIYDFVVSELTAIQADLPAAAGPATYGRATGSRGACCWPSST